MTGSVVRLLAVALAGVLAVGGVARAEGEAELGRRFLLEARGELPLIEDPTIVGYVERVGNRIVDAVGTRSWDYHFYVVEDRSLNAFAVPGGYVFVFSGLLARIHNDDELAGVLGHEIAHAHAHHIERQQKEGQVWTAAALLGLLASAVNPVLGAAGIAAAQTAQLKYSRDFEQEADFMGLRFSSDAGYDPHALGTFFKELLADQRVNSAGVPAYMLTHPLTEERVGKVETIISNEKLKTPPGRPASAAELPEVQAVARAIAEPTDLVVARYKKEAEEKPNDAERQFLLGRVYQTVGQLDSARVAFERTRDLGGLGGRVDRPLGAVYVSLNKPTEARAVLERHLAKHPEDGFSHLQLGKALADSGDEAGSLKELQRAITLSPDLDEAQRLAGLAYGHRGNEAEGFYHLAIASRLRGELEQSLSHFKRTEPLLDPGSARQQEVQQAIAELVPIVRERERERLERRRPRRGLGVEAPSAPPFGAQRPRQ
jgi:predicted Zn-dependent protease